MRFCNDLIMLVNQDLSIHIYVNVEICVKVTQIMLNSSIYTDLTLGLVKQVLTEYVLCRCNTTRVCKDIMIKPRLKYCLYRP